MACKYTYKGKTYSEEAFKALLANGELAAQINQDKVKVTFDIKGAKVKKGIKQWIAEEKIGGEIAGFKQGIKQGIAEGKINQKNISEKVVEYISNSPLAKSLPIGQVKNLIKKAGRITTEGQMDKFLRAYNNIAYKAQEAQRRKSEQEAAQQRVKQANATRKRIRKGVKNVFANEKQVIKDFLRINPNQVEDIEEYNQVASRILDTVLGARAKDGKAQRTDAISLEEIDEYNKRNENAVKEPEIKESRQKLIEMAERLGIKNADILSEDALIDEIQNVKAEQIDKANEEFSTIINEKKKTVKETFEKSDEGAPLIETLSEQMREDYDTLMRIEPSKLSLREKAVYIDILNNMAENGSLAGSGQMVIEQLVREGEKEIKKGFKRYKTGKPKEFYKATDGVLRNTFKGYAEFRSHIPALIKYISLNNVIAGLVRAHTGLQRLWSDTAKVNTKSEMLMENIEKIKAKYPETRTSESMVKMGIAGAMIQTMGGTRTDVDKDFKMYKKLVEQSIQVRLASTDEVTRQRGKIEQQVFNDYFARAQNKQEVLDALSQGERKVLEEYQKAFNAEFDALNENSEVYYNETLPQVDGYLPMVWEKNADFVEETDKDIIDNLMASAFLNDIVNKRASGTTISRQRIQSIFNKNGEARRLLSFDFDYNMNKKYREALYQTNTAKWRMLADQSLKSKWFADSFGKRNAEKIYRAFKETVKHQIGAYDYKSEFEKAVVQQTNKIAQRAAGVVLASPLQFIKQSVSVLFGTGINLKGRYNLLFKQPSVDFKSNIFRYSNLPERIKTRAGTKMESYITDAEKAAFRKDYENLVVNGLMSIGYSAKDAYKWTGENIDKISEWFLTPLVKGDMWAAKKSWMAYYAQYMMDNKGVKKINWDAQIDNPDLEASAYADQMVEQSQNTNQQALRGQMFRRTKSYFDILRGMYMAFSEFAANQQTRTRVAFRQMRKGMSVKEGIDKEMTLTGMRELASVVGENSFYAGVTMGIGIGTTMGAQAFYQALTGASDEEAEELIKLDYEFMLKQSVSKLGKDLLLGGMPSPIDQAGSDVLNEGLKGIMGEEKDLLYLPKEGSTWGDKVKEYGIYGSVLDKWAHTYEDGKNYLTGEMPMITKAGMSTKGEEGTYKLSQRERSAFGWFFLMDIANLVGVNIQEVNAVVNKTRHALEKDLQEEKLGKKFTIEMWKKGSDYQQVSGSRPTTKEKTRSLTKDSSR